LADLCYSIIVIKKSKLHLIFILALVVPFFIPAISLADVLGDQKTFNVESQFDRFSRSSVAATLRTISDNAYFYVEDQYWNNLNSVEQRVFNADMKELANEFETVIYPKERQFWGSEPNPGIDNDPKITILFEELTRNYGGYFETVNLAPKTRAGESNEREMFVVSAQSLDTDVVKNFLAHEFQHLISYNQKELTRKTIEDVWLNELRSEYAVSLLGYNNIYSGSNLERRVQSFVSNPSDSLTEWPNVAIDYAMVTVFGEYLVDRFSSSMLNETLHYPSYGIPSLNQYLTSKGVSFNDVFMDWMAAVYLNNQSVDPRFGYTRSDLVQIKVQSQSQVFISDSINYNSGASLKDWQPYWSEFQLTGVSDSKSLKFDINSFGQNFLASYVAYYHDGSVEVKRIPVASNKATGYVPNSSGKKLNKVVLLLAKAQKIVDFGKDEPASTVSIQASMIDNSVVESQTLKDGVLIKRPRESEIYVIWGKYKRYLHPDVIRLYGHLDPSKAIEVEPEIFNSYQTANYVRNVNEQKVYAIWPDGTKHWMNITAQHWDATGRDWNAIFIINDLELNFYRIGPDIRQ